MMGRAFLLLPVLATACLPLGSEPAGRHVVHDRTLSALQFVPSQNAGVPAHLVVFGQTRASRLFEHDMADLHAVPPELLAGPARAVGDLPLLLSDAQLPGPYDSSFSFAQTDAQGRMVVLREDARAADPSVWRVDPATSAREWLGSTFAGDPAAWRDEKITLSPRRERVVVARPGSGWAVVEPDGSSVEVPSAGEGSAGFVDEDFFYTVDDWSESTTGETSSYAIRVVRPQARPELVAGNARLLEGFSTPEGPRLVVVDRTGSGRTALERARLLDPEAGTAETIPFSPSQDEWLGLSPDRQWFAWRGASEIQFYNWSTGQRGRSGPYLAPLLWRPSHHELWFAGASTMVLRPTANSDRVFARANPYWLPGGTSWSMFTPSGRHWLVRDFCDGAPSTCDGAERSWSDEAIYVASADQPTALPVQIAAKEVALYRAWELSDGRILVEGFTQDAVRSDLYLYDPRSLATTVFPLKGFVVATGAARALVFANWELGRWAGRLLLLDLATGAQTVLAESAYAARVDPGCFSDAPPADRLAPGTRVAYLVRHQIDSPWDGLWVAELP